MPGFFSNVLSCFNPARALLAAAGMGLLLAAAGCDQQRVSRMEVGVSTEADVKREFGEPPRTVERADGSKVLEYPRQPEGSTNLKITIGADGRLVSIRQQLSPENFAEVQPGMPQQAVRDLLGQPATKRRYDLKPDEEHWDWRFVEGQKRRVFTVTFDRDANVLRTETTDDQRDMQTGG